MIDDCLNRRWIGSAESIIVQITMTPLVSGGSAVVRTHIPGVFCTYKTLKNGVRQAYWYHRSTGKRLRGSPTTPEFIVDYAAAEQSLVASRGDLMTGLIREYTLGIEFQKLGAATQREYRRMLTKAESVFGDMPLAAVNDPRVRKEFLDWRESIAIKTGEREADNRLSVLSAMFTWAVDRGRLAANHLRGFQRLYSNSRADLIWLPADINAFMSVAPIELQRALILALHTGQRQGDLLRLQWASYDGETITLRQGKSTRKGVPGPTLRVRCSRALRTMLDSIPRTSKFILSTKTGAPFKKRWFAQLWKRASSEAGIVSLHFNDLRGTSVTMLAEAGNTIPQIATVTGHSLKTVTTILEKYLARTTTLSEDAITNFENSPRTKFANRLQTTARQTKIRTNK